MSSKPVIFSSLSSPFVINDECPIIKVFLNELSFLHYYICVCLNIMYQSKINVFLFFETNLSDLVASLCLFCQTPSPNKEISRTTFDPAYSFSILLSFLSYIYNRYSLQVLSSAYIQHLIVALHSLCYIF